MAGSASASACAIDMIGVCCNPMLLVTMPIMPIVERRPPGVHSRFGFA